MPSSGKGEERKRLSFFNKKKNVAIDDVRKRNRSKGEGNGSARPSEGGKKPSLKILLLGEGLASPLLSEEARLKGGEEKKLPLFYEREIGKIFVYREGRKSRNRVNWKKEEYRAL